MLGSLIVFAKTLFEICLSSLFLKSKKVLINLIPKPNVSLILEYGYIDNVEKQMFASNYLEYLITTHHEVTLDLNNPTFVDSLNDITGLVKEMYYFIRLKLNKNGITKYSKSELDKYKDYSILSGNILDDIEINVSNEYNLVEYNDVKGNIHQIEAYEMMSICLQHEIDHLNGVLFIDHLPLLKQKMVKKKLTKLAMANA